MEEKYVTPGNQDRGWNDPPQFSYGLQKNLGAQRNPLTKRAPSGGGVPPMTPPSSNPLARPPAAPGVGVPPITPPSSNPLAPPPAGPAPPPGCSATPPPPSGPMRKETEATSQSESEPDVEEVMSALNRALAACRHTVKEQVCNDVAKRLGVLEVSWRSGKLSLPVRRRMNTLSLELQCCRWDRADELHLSLMVDHVTEVSQWMVGVKRLIAETRKLSPQLLESLQTPLEPQNNTVEPTREPLEPAQEPDTLS